MYMKTNRLSRLRAWFAQGNRTALAVFILFALVLFLKTMIFHWTCFHSVLISSLWKNPTEFFRFWGGKITPILFLGSFVFLSKRYGWTIIVHVLTDIWLIANLFYYKANTLFLSVETMKMADNMSGFWGSLLTYMGWDIFIMPIITILYVAILLLLHLQKANQRKYPHFAITLSLSIALMVFCNYAYGLSMKLWNAQNSTTEEINEKWRIHKKFNYYFPLGVAYYFGCKESSVDFNAFSFIYVPSFSIISYFPACVVYNFLSPVGEIIQLTDFQKKVIGRYIHNEEVDSIAVPKTNLIFILCES